jgi:hypothetical protein
MSRLKAWLWLVVGAAFTIGLLYYGVKGIASVVSDQMLWKSATPALSAHARGKERSNRIILKDYEFEVEFLDAQRAVHRGKVEFTSLFTGVDPNRSPEVRCDPLLAKARLQSAAG